MLFRKDSAKLRDENFLINKIKAKIVIRAASLNTVFENIFKTNIKISHHYMTIMTKSLQ